MTLLRCNTIQTKILFHLILFASAIDSQAQIITSWEDNRLPKSEVKGIISYIDETDMSKQSEIQDWNNTLTAFEYIKEVSDEEIKEEIKNNDSITESIKQVFLNNKQLNLPTCIDENGIDLYMLTDEGISIYMMFDNAAFVRRRL